MNEELKTIAAKVRRLLAIDEHYDNGSVTLMLTTDEANALRNAVSEAIDALSRPAPAVQVPERRVLAQIIDALPMRRDWLDPTLEREAKALLLAPAPVATEAEHSFGAGEKVVCRGTHGGRPAVFIAPAKMPGTVGEDASRENAPRDRLVAGEIVLTFPTEAQAVAVEAALLNVATEAVAQGGGVGAGTLAKAIRRIDRRHDLSALSLAEAILAELPKVNSHALLASPAGTVGDGMVGVPVEALRWLFGIGHDAFTEPPNAIGRFWWRSEFAVRAGIDQMALLLPPAPAATKKGEGE